VRLSTFRKLWRQLLPHVVQTRPMTDLCWECQQNNDAVQRSANLPDEVKTERVKRQEAHLSVVHQERSLYNDMVHNAKQAAAAAGIVKLGEHCDNTSEMTMHYSFDYAQQVHYPSSPLQPGPMYFLVPRKCGIFGVCCEALPQQINYLIDEGMCSSKGSNAVISYIHHFFEKWGLGEKHLNLHCDNCSGQNKNNYVLWYLAWRVIKGLHSSITINFMVPGHTKFAPDWCFGLMKQTYRRTHVSSLADICNAVSSSTLTEVNVPQLVGSENGNVYVPTLDWQSFLSKSFRSLPGIKKFHHFRFVSEQPGLVTFKINPDDSEQSFDLRSRQADFASVPHEVPPPGLPLERQRYLYGNIRQFVVVEAQDTVCPQPPGEEDTDVPEAGPGASAVPEPAAKRKRKSR